MHDESEPASGGRDYPCRLAEIRCPPRVLRRLFMSGHFGARAAPDSQAEMANVSDAKAITTNCSAISHFRSPPDHPSFTCTCSTRTN